MMNRNISGRRTISIDKPAEEELVTNIGKAATSELGQDKPEVFNGKEVEGAAVWPMSSTG